MNLLKDTVNIIRKNVFYKYDNSVEILVVMADNVKQNIYTKRYIDFIGSIRHFYYLINFDTNYIKSRRLMNFL